MSQPTESRSRRRPRKRAAGEGTIYQRPDGLWVGEVMIGYQPDGRPDRRRVSARTQEDCLAKLDEVRRQFRQGLLTEPHKLTMADLLDQWLADSLVRGLKPKTIDSYRQIVRLYLLPSLGKVKLAVLRPEHVRKLLASLVERGLAATTVRYVRHLLHGALRFAVQMELVSRNVADSVRAPKARRITRKTPTPADLAKLLDAAEANGDRLRALWTLAAYTGCRPGELLALQWRDVDLVAGIITIQHNLSAVRGQPLTIVEPKTVRGRRRIPIPAEAVAVLRAHRQRQLEERLLLGPDYSDHELAFATHGGGLLHPDNVRRDFKKALRRAGLPATYRPYDLRHAYATMLFAAGEHPKVVSERLGHASVALTLDTYTHAVHGVGDDTGAKVERIIRGVGEHAGEGEHRGED